MKGKREFPPDVVGAGDVLSHLSTYSFYFFYAFILFIFYPLVLFFIYTVVHYSDIQAAI